MATFFNKLQARWDAGARVCIGLDSDYEKIPADFESMVDVGRRVYFFNTEIVDYTKDSALAYKPNVAFYSGRNGTERAELQHALALTISHIKNVAPDVPVILDAKRADIGNTNLGYVAEAFEAFDADAVTVSHYFGMEAMKPFLDQKEKGIIVLCRTSNPGAEEFQDLIVERSVADQVDYRRPPDKLPFYAYVAHRVNREWNYNNNCALVVGATHPEQLGVVRDIAPQLWLLIPGYGTQGGDLEASVRNGVNSSKSGIIINESSSVIFASSGRNFAEAARARVLDTTQKMNEVLATL